MPDMTPEETLEALTEVATRMRALMLDDGIRPELYAALGHALEAVERVRDEIRARRG
jgi:hypothetical protein